MSTVFIVVVVVGGGDVVMWLNGATEFFFLLLPFVCVLMYVYISMFVCLYVGHFVKTRLAEEPGDELHLQTCYCHC